MGNLTVLALRIVLAMMLAGSVFVQVVMVPLFWRWTWTRRPAGVRVPVVAIVVLGHRERAGDCVCVWRLLTMVRRGTVFSDGAFRYVDVIIGSAVAAASCSRSPWASSWRRARTSRRAWYC